jgi:asparagine synthase (glutamine-hydrolysing)
VLLSGTGGDEMLGQALDPRVQLADLLRQMRFRTLAKQSKVWSQLLRRPWIHLLLEAFLLQLPTPLRSGTTETAKIDSWVGEQFARKHRLSLRQLEVGKGSPYWLASTRDWFHTVNMLTRQLSSAWPCREQIRYPYLDQTLVEFLTSIPTEQLLRPGDRRSLMRRALRDLLPSKVLARRVKSHGGRYFSVALQRYWPDVQRICDTPMVTSHLGWVKPDQFCLALEQAKHGHWPENYLRLLRMLSWELWLRKAIEHGAITLGSDS